MPRLDLVAVFIVEDAAFKVRDLIAVLVPGGDGQQPKGLTLYCREHLARVKVGHHPVELFVVNGGCILRIGSICILPDSTLCDPVQEHPMGVILPPTPRAVECGGAHNVGNGGVYLKGIFQVLPGKVHRHQGIAWRTVGPHPQREDIEGLGSGNIPSLNVPPDDPVRGHSEGDGGVILPLQFLHRGNIGRANKVAGLGFGKVAPHCG